VTIIDENNPEKVVCENQFINPKFPSAAVPVAKVRGCVELLAAQRSLQFIALEPTRVKKAFTGIGNANKECMVKMANSLFGVDVTDNTADAIAMAYTYFKEERDNGNIQGSSGNKADIRRAGKVSRARHA
jgi:Holliday junction resolvasome RuvABC endonuclease subunit